MRGVILCLLLSVLLLPWLAAAQCPGMQQIQTPFAKETLTVSTTVRGLTPAVFQPAGSTATLAVIQIQGAPIVYDVVTTPTTTDSQTAGIGTLSICGIDTIRAFKALRLTTTDAQLVIYYYKSRQP